MKITKAYDLAQELINKTFEVSGKSVSAAAIGYSFTWLKTKRSLGQCDCTYKTIGLSEEYVRNNDVDMIKDTILHELAHAFSIYLYGMAGHGHNHVWKHVCVQIGAVPERCKHNVEMSYKYVLRHKETHEIYSKFHRFPSKTHKRCLNNEIWIRGRPQLKGKLEVVAAYNS